MEPFDFNDIVTYYLEPKDWFRYVDSTFAVFLYSKKELNGFLNHFNFSHSAVKFPMKIEPYEKLFFLDGITHYFVLEHETLCFNSELRVIN